jgi:hypothetical protein
MGSVHSIVQDEWYYKKECPPRVPKKVTEGYKSRRMAMSFLHFEGYTDQVQLFVQCIFSGEDLLQCGQLKKH